MKSLSDLKATRRRNLALLMETYGQSSLTKLTGLDPAHLYQMSKAKGRQARNVNDEKARLVEEKLGLAPGWLDQDRFEITPDISAPQEASSEVPTGWPFDFDPKLLEGLTPGQLVALSGMIKGWIIDLQSGGQSTKPSLGRPRKKTA